MKTITKITTGLLIIIGIFLPIACEKDSSVNEGDSFSLDPSSITLGQSNTAIIIVTRGGHQPVAWTVSDETLGSISGSGTQVTYTRTTKNGINVVTCKDEAGWTATARIAQQDDTPPMDPLQISPTSATLAHDDDEVVFTASGGSGGYRWYVSDRDEGEVRVLDNTQALYRRKMQGDNNVEVQDSEGHVAVATVVQPPLAALVVSPTSANVSSNGGTQVFTASGGTQSYTWQVVTGGGAHGQVDPLTGATTLYTSLEDGQDIIRLSDGVSIVFITVTKK